MTRPWPEVQPELSDGVVLLRPWRMADTDAVFRACQDLDIQHFTAVPSPYAEQDAQEFLAGQPEQWASGTGAGFAVTEPDSGDVVGSIGLHEPDTGRAQAAVGYWTAPWARRRGSTRRALLLLTDWALSDVGLERVFLDAEEVNLASTAVARSAGFHRVPGPPREVQFKGTARWMVTWEALRGWTPDRGR